MKNALKRLTPSFIWNPLRDRTRAGLHRLLLWLLDEFDLQAIGRSDFYSPLPYVPKLRQTLARWDKPSSLEGLTYDLHALKQNLRVVLEKYTAEFTQLPPYEENRKLGFGPGYTALDALTLYCMIRHHKPRRYLEVGSGLSTYYCSLAAARNAQEGSPLQITCIEPYPYEKLKTIPDIRLIVDEVQNLPPSFVDELQSGDVFFIDSSHVVKIDGDVSFLYLEAVPRLKLGVHLHCHDVPFPYNTPYPASHWVLRTDYRPMFWTEAMLVQAFLAFNDRFQIELSTPLIRHHDEPFLQNLVPNYQPLSENPNTFSSLWLRRIR
ncbi:MAG: class I SAM-dependent methyltransferase [Phycisphaeraceae bacterium]|nr:class I SAM-dependent methyltransferase [Phycisphaeraceae bacterium]